MKKLLAKPLIQGIIKSLPIIGEIKTNVDSVNGESKGKIDYMELFQALVRLIIVIAILRGILSVEEAEGIIDVVK